MRNIITIIFTALLCTLSGICGYTQQTHGNSFYIIKLHKEINAASARMVTDALRQAEETEARWCILDLNTYGGAVDAADSIRSAIMESSIPVIAFINNQAVSAGALISIACDSIYMKNGSTFGAATVVDQQGEVLPDKYQSFMRAMMRSTAESHGKRQVVQDGDTLEVWIRDPNIAQAMVSRDSVLSFTPAEAIANGYCNGAAESIEDVIAKTIDTSKEKYTVTEHAVSATKGIIYFFLNPIIQGLLLMLIIGGIYYEFQSPGIGFPLAAAITGIVLYFVPLYLEGFVQNWELIFFFIGLILLAVELFVLPGFGVAGISGCALIIITLAFAMIDNGVVFDGKGINPLPLVKPFAIVLVSTASMLFISIFLLSRMFPTRAFSHIALKTNLSSGREGYVGVETDKLAPLVGRDAVVATDLKPQGTVLIDGKTWQAQLNVGYAQKGEIVEILGHEGGRLYCKKKIN